MMDQLNAAVAIQTNGIIYPSSPSYFLVAAVCSVVFLTMLTRSIQQREGVGRYIQDHPLDDISISNHRYNRVLAARST